MGFLGDFFCCGKARVICDYTVICVRKNKMYYYRKTQVIFIHLDVHFHTNKRYKERAVFLDLICVEFCSKITCIGCFCHFNLTFLLLITIGVRGSMKLV